MAPVSQYNFYAVKSGLMALNIMRENMVMLIEPVKEKVDWSRSGVVLCYKVQRWGGEANRARHSYFTCCQAQE